MAETTNFQEHLNKLDLNAELTTQEIEAIDAITNNVDEVHLKEALASTCLTVDGAVGSHSMASLIDDFSQHVEESDGWVLKLKATSTNTPVWITKMLGNIKNNDLAYFVQKISNLLDYKVQKWYGEAKENVQVSADKILGRQTKRALSWLKNWIQEDIKTQNEKKEYTRMKFVDKKFLDGLVKDATTTAAKNTILAPYHLQWSETASDFVALDGYERIDMYGSNYAVDVLDGKRNSSDVSLSTDKIAILDDTTAVSLAEKYKVTITKESPTSYIIENWTESVEISYDAEDIDSPYSVGNFSFADIDSAIYVAKEINNIMTKVKNNQLPLNHFELSSDDQYLQADYATRVVDFWSWNPLKMWQYSWIYDVNILDLNTFINNNGDPIGIDKKAFVDFMNEYYDWKKWSPAFKKIETGDDKKVTVKSNGESISYKLPANPNEDSIIKLKAWALTLPIPYGEDGENINRVCATINYIVSLVRNSWEKLDYFESDGKKLQVDYVGRYFDIDYLDDVKTTVGVEPKLFANWLNQYRKTIWTNV